MLFVGVKAAYALELDSSGHLAAVFYGGGRIPINETSSAIFSVNEQFPSFKWGHVLEENMPAGPLYHVLMQSEKLQREIRVWKDEVGQLFVLIAVQQCEGTFEFRYQIEQSEAPDAFHVTDELEREWAVDLKINSELVNGNAIILSEPAVYAFTFSLQHSSLSAIVTSTVEEAAVLSAVLGHERYSVAVIPPDTADLATREFSNSPMFRALAKLNCNKIVTSENLGQLASRFKGRAVSAAKILQDTEAQPELRTPRSTLAEAVLVARENRLRIVVDDNAFPISVPDKDRMIFYEGDGVSSIVAANFAFDLSAGLKRLPRVSDELRKKWTDTLSTVRSNRGPRKLPLRLWIRLRIRTLKNFFTGAKERPGLEYYRSEVDDSIEALSAEVQTFYSKTINETREACVFLDSVDIPLTLGFDLPLGHIPNVIAPYFIARELASIRSVVKQPFTAAICDAGVAGTRASELISESASEMSNSNWLVYSYGSDNCDLGLIFRMQTADFIYLITHAGPGGYGDRGQVEQSDGEPFLGREMAEIRFPGEPLVFNNACASWPEFGGTVLRAGACSYVGTLWPVFADLASKVGSQFKKRMIRGYSWSAALASATAEMPAGEKRAYFVVGTGFRTFPVVQPELSAVELAVQGSGMQLYEEAWDLAALRSNHLKSAMPMAWLTLRAASRILGLPGDWQWIPLAEYISITASVPLIDQWKMHQPMIMTGLAALRTAYERDNWQEHPEQMSSRAALREALYDLHHLAASAAFQFDDWTTSAEIEEKLLENCIAWKHEEMLPSVKNNLAKSYVHLGQADKADALLQESIAEKIASGMSSRVADSLLTLTISMQKNGEYEKAIPILDRLITHWSRPEGFETISSSSAQKKLCIALANRASSFVATGLAARAIDDLNQALAGFRMLNMPTDVFKTHLQLAHAYFLCGQHAEAKRHLKSAYSFSTDFSKLAPNVRQALDQMSEQIDAHSEEPAATSVSPRSSLPGNVPELPAPPPAAIPDVNARIESLKLKVAVADTPGAVACSIGILYFSLGQPKEALKWFRMWERDGYPEPLDSEVDWKSCAIGFEYAIRAEVNDSRQVEQAFRSLLQRKPDCSQILTEFGSWLFLEGRYEEAEANLKQGLELDPEDVQAMCYLAEVEIKRGNRRAAIELFGAAVQILPHPQTYKQLGLLFQEEGELDGAALHFKRAALLGMTDAYWNLAQIEEERGYATGVKMHLEKYLEADPRDSEGWLWLFQGLFSDGSFDRAAEAATNALVVGRTNPRSLLAWILSENFQTSEELEIMSEKEIAFCHSSLSKESLDSGSKRKLIDFIEKDRLTLIKRIFLAVLYEQEGQLDTALSLLDAILKQNPQHYLSNMLKYQFLLDAGRAREADQILRFVLACEQMYSHYARILLEDFKS